MTLGGYIMMLGLVNQTQILWALMFQAAGAITFNRGTEGETMRIDCWYRDYES
jgi:hypothetical protein